MAKMEKLDTMQALYEKITHAAKKVTRFLTEELDKK
jgi:hypothetical protein